MGPGAMPSDCQPAKKASKKEVLRYRILGEFTYPNLARQPLNRELMERMLDTMLDRVLDRILEWVHRQYNKHHPCGLNFVHVLLDGEGIVSARLVKRIALR